MEFINTIEEPGEKVTCEWLADVLVCQPRKTGGTHECCRASPRSWPESNRGNGGRSCWRTGRYAEHNEHFIEVKNMERDKKEPNFNEEQSDNEIIEGVPAYSPLVAIIDKIAERVEPILELLKTYFEHTLKRERASAKLQLNMTWIAFAIVVLVVVVSGTLTYFDKIDGSTFTFLLGLVVGYVLTFVRDAIRPPEE